jgi:hypothetical protein
MVVDVSTEKAVFKWLGIATTQQLERIFDDGEHALVATFLQERSIPRSNGNAHRQDHR